MSAVFDFDATSLAPDRRTRYRFASSSLAIVHAQIGDLIVCRLTSRTGRPPGYVAAARIFGVESDPDSLTWHHAILGSFTMFDRVVPFKQNGIHVENAFRYPISKSGISQAAFNKIRVISAFELQRILAAAFDTEEELLLKTGSLPQFAVAPEPWRALEEPPQRAFVAETVTRPRRDPVFRRNVLAAYAFRCAFTGSNMRVGDAVEVEAVHIDPVANRGRDIVANGIALSRSVHWAFDRHLLSVGEDLRVLIARDRVWPSIIADIERHGGRMTLPAYSGHHPSQQALARHRQAFFAINAAR